MQNRTQRVITTMNPVTKAATTMNSATNSDEPLASFPLITPNDLRADPRVASLRTPPGVVAAWPGVKGTTWLEWSSDNVDDGLPLEMEDQTMVVWFVEGSGTTPTTPFILDAAFAAILNEATRFDGSLRTHSNRSAGDPTATYYLRFRPAKGSPEGLGSFIVARIVVNAEAREVAYSPDNKRDLRQVGLSPDGKRNGKATRNARDDLRAHAERSASANAPQGFDVPAYLANLDALFAYYDETTPGAFVVEQGDD
jgi:hypothetical protein